MKRQKYQRPNQATSIQAYWKSDRSKEHRRKLSEAARRPDVVERKREAHKAIWRDPRRAKKLRAHRTGGRKLSDADVIEIRHSELPYSQLAAKYSVSTATIWGVKHRKKYAHVEETSGRTVWSVIRRYFEGKKNG